jgi:ketosteroid isomerase-like protein
MDGYLSRGEALEAAGLSE